MYKLALLRAAGYLELRKREKATKTGNTGLTPENKASLKGKFECVKHHLLPHCLFAHVLYYPAKILAMILDPGWFLHGSESDRN